MEFRITEVMSRQERVARKASDRCCPRTGWLQDPGRNASDNAIASSQEGYLDSYGFAQDARPACPGHPASCGVPHPGRGNQRLGVWRISSQDSRVFREDFRKQLSDIDELKINQLMAWQAERKADAVVAMTARPGMPDLEKAVRGEPAPTALTAFAGWKRSAGVTGTPVRNSSIGAVRSGSPVVPRRRHSAFTKTLRRRRLRAPNWSSAISESQRSSAVGICRLRPAA